MEDISLMLILMSILENTLIVSLVFSLLLIKIRDRRFIITVLLSTFIQLFIRTLPVIPLVIAIAGIISIILCIRYFYKKPLVVLSISSTLSIITYMFLEGVIVPILLRLSIYSYQDIIANTALRLFFFACQLISFLLVIIIVRKRNISLHSLFSILNYKELEVMADDEFDFSREKRVSSTFYLVIVFLLLQGLFINAYTWGQGYLKGLNISNFFTSAFFINTIIILLNFTLLYLLRHLILIMRMERNDVIKRIKERNTLRLDWEKRAQIHDNNHHLGMLYMLLQTNKIDRAREYLKGMVGEIQNVEAIVRSGNQTLNALIRSKIACAKQHGVFIKIEVLNQLKQMYVYDWDLNRIIGNLLDNAIEAIEQIDGNKLVELIIDGGDRNYIGVVTHGILISDELENRIFEKGYTSKEDVNHGLGLAICKELVQKYNGNINIKKNPEENYTSFQVFLPGNS